MIEKNLYKDNKSPSNEFHLYVSFPVTLTIFMLDNDCILKKAFFNKSTNGFYLQSKTLNQDSVSVVFHQAKPQMTILNTDDNKIHNNNIKKHTM